MKNTVFREVTPLSSKDCFTVFSRVKKEFTYPIHTHTDYELNFVENGKGSKRVVGDSVEVIDDLELTLITGSELSHAWLNHQCESPEIKEITIQFHPDLLSESTLARNQFRSIKTLFDNANLGVTFPRETILKVKERIESLTMERAGVHSVLKLFSILYDLSLSPNIRILSSTSFQENEQSFDSRRIEKAYNYMSENYNKPFHLQDVASQVNMSETAFSKFIKQRTGRNFIDILNEIRLGHASRMLIETTHSVSEICYACGFNNLSNFNRLFKNKKKCTPKEFRDNYNGARILL